MNTLEPQFSLRQNVFTFVLSEGIMSPAMGLQFKQQVDLFRKHGGSLRMSDALRLGISRKALYAMRDAGILRLLTRGTYRLASLKPLAQPDLVVVATRIPQGVLCLISALSFHELTTQVPHAIDVALERGSRKPRLDHPPTRFFWFSGPAFHEGIEIHTIDGAAVRVYDPEKTIVDSFRYRRQIGMDVVLEALKEWRARRPKKLDRLLRYARLRRADRAMRPYLEALQ